MRKIDNEYKDLYRFITQQGMDKGDRTGVGTTSALGGWMRFDLRGGLLPITSLRVVRPEKFIHEMLWFVSGDSSIKYLKDNNVSIWDSWFMKGTDKYEQDRHWTLNELADLYVEKDGVMAFASLCESVPSGRVGLGFSDMLDLVKDESADQVEISVSEGAMKVSMSPRQSEILRENLLEKLNINSVAQHAKHIFLQARLNRIPKEDTEKWGAIIDLINRPDGFKDEDGVIVTKAGEYTVFRNGEWVKVGLSAQHGQAVWQLLDELKVPATRLIDADIGKGGYGPQWRNWQDAQIVDDADVDAYRAQGYELITEVDNLDFDHRFYGKAIMHRDIDQLQNAIDMLKKDPDSRRINVTAWNPGRTWQAALPPCHLYFQFISYEKDLNDYEDYFAQNDLTAEYIESIKDDVSALASDEDAEEKFAVYAKDFAVSKGLPTRWLSIGVVLRSWDTPAGGVFNTPQYAVLLRMVAEVVGMDARELFIVGMDAHIYHNQKPMVDDVIYTDSPNDFPKLVIKRKVTDIDDFKIDDFELVGYSPVENTKIMPIAR